MTANQFVALSVFLIGGIIFWMPRFAGHVRGFQDFALLHVLLMAVSLLAPHGSWAFVAVAATSALHAVSAFTISRTGAVWFVAAALASIAAAIGVHLGVPLLAFLGSSLAIALRVGLAPVHAGVSRLCERSPALQSQQLATAVFLLVAHLRYIDHSSVAYDVAAWLVRVGAILTLVPALVALVQRDLRGFYRAATVMHGGMLFAAMGAAGRGHTAAALMVMLTTAAAMTGLGLMVQALEERVGAVSLLDAGGRAHAFPKLAASFVIFAGAGVAMPGTAGFIADDLLLHALWEESVWGTATVILGSAVLAIAALSAFAKVFLGAAKRSVAPDLRRPERIAAVVLLLMLVWLGLTPGIVLTPADAFFRSPSALLSLG